MPVIPTPSHLWGSEDATDHRVSIIDELGGGYGV